MMTKLSGFYSPTNWESINKLEETIRRISLSDIERNYEDTINRNETRKNDASDRQKEYVGNFKKNMLEMEKTQRA